MPPRLSHQKQETMDLTSWQSIVFIALLVLVTVGGIVTYGVWNKKKCTQCMNCWMYCPDMAIPQKKGKRVETDFDFCKGCGICKQVCPFGAIEMEKEKK